MHEWEQYRNRFASNRPETFDALVDAWQKDSDARRRFTGWSIFSRCALAEPAMRRDRPHDVARAETIMERAGYEVGPPTTRGARRWIRSGG